MSLSLNNLASTKERQNSKPPVMVIYGVGKIGKTSLASEFPSPVYLCTDGERPPSDVDLPSPGTVGTFTDLLDVLEELITGEHDFQTVIIDSLDGLEPLIWQATSERLGVGSIEEAGYGKGYVEAETEWSEYFAALSALADAGIAVVQIAHPEIKRFDSPTSDPYDRYDIKLHKKASARVREHADVIAFMNYRVSLKEKDVGFKKTVTHAEGGSDRVIYLEERAGFIAGNRYTGMPASITYRRGKGFDDLAKYFPAPSSSSNDNAEGDAEEAA